MTVLVVGPGGGDDANRVLMSIGREVLSTASPQPECVELWEGSATRARVDQHLTANPDIMYFGHGTPSSLGHPEILIDHANIGASGGRVVLAMACSSAEELGNYATQQGGVNAYLGFTREVVLPGGPMAHWTIEPWCVAGITLLNGKTAAEAVNEQRQALDREGDRVRDLTEGSRGYRVMQMQALRGYARSFVHRGKPYARLA